MTTFSLSKTTPLSSRSLTVNHLIAATILKPPFVFAGVAPRLTCLLWLEDATELAERDELEVIWVSYALRSKFRPRYTYTEPALDFDLD
jgi:hypothetical protein